MEKGKMCISCKKRPIDVKKWKRCNRCYQVYRKKKGIRGCRDFSEKKIAYQSEIDFIRNFFTHTNWVYHPVFFRLNGGGYQPDFYDGERNIFIEVAGTRQAFQRNKEKYQEFMKVYPKIKFEIRYFTGELLLDMKFHISEKR